MAKKITPPDDAATATLNDAGPAPTAKKSAKKAAPKKAAAKKVAAKKTAAVRGKKGAAEGDGAGEDAPRKSDDVTIKAASAAGKNLIIVESPAKARTIEKYLGPDFRVMASMGHIIDLPVSKIGVDVDNNFEPMYEVIKGKKAIVDAIKRQARVAKAVYLAPDPDREGEAIAHHIATAIRDSAAGEVYRATFNEITKNAVRVAIDNPRVINDNLFNAQQARRVLDRLVGYKLSPLLWKKVRRGLSAGRVQSVAVRIICDREREIRLFNPVEYWTIEGEAAINRPPPFVIHLAKIEGDKAEIHNQAESDAIMAELNGKPFVVGEVIKKEVKKRPFAPFITSTLQQEASRKLRMTAKRTMALAQQLYEAGYITYMRTDSTRLSDDAIGQARAYIEKSFGKDYLPEGTRVYTSKKSAQDAHEAVRPTEMIQTPELLAGLGVEAAQVELYKLIWQRTIACQMVDAILERTRVEIPVGRFLFVANGSTVKFEGYMKVYQEAKDEAGKSESDTENAEPVLLEDDETLPPLEAGQTLKLNKLGGSQHFTMPPPRYTEAGLIKELEKQGIGRPSTYAAIISTVQDKEYVTKESGTFRPSDLGFLTTDLLTESFPHILDVKFTAAMEDQLDHVEDGSVNWVELLRNFYIPFNQKLEQAATQMRNVKAEIVPTEHVCDKCGSPMVIRWGRNGKFLACSGFPACRNTKPIEEDESGNVKIQEVETTDKVCPNCSKPMAVKNGRRGKFLACTGYPECKTTMPYAIGITCPRCGKGDLVERRSARGMTFYSCNNYPECKFSVFEKPYQAECETCHTPHWFVGMAAKKKYLAGERLPNCPFEEAKGGKEKDEE